METRLGRFPTLFERPEPLKFAWPLVVLPELFATAGHLAVLAGHFATLGWEVYAPDLRIRAGKETAPGLARLGFEDLVGLAAEALDALGREAIVVGHGMGGLVAFKLAERAQVKAAVALAPLVPGFETPLFMHGRNLLSMWRGRPIHPPRGRMLLELLSDADPFHRAQTIKTMDAGATAAARQIARGAVSFGQGEREVARLVVAGELDRFAPYNKVEAFARSLGAALAPIAGRGHWLVAGRALEATVTQVQRFLVRALGHDLLLLYQEDDGDSERDQ